MSSRGSNGWLSEEESFGGFAWGEEAGCFAGSFVEFFGDRGQVGLVVGGVFVFGEVLADQWVDCSRWRGVALGSGSAK